MALAQRSQTAEIIVGGGQLGMLLATQLTEKTVYFRQVIHQDFDLTGISRFVLGSYWRVASPAERRQFRSLFVDRLVRFYGRQLTQSADGDFVVIGGRTDPEGLHRHQPDYPSTGYSDRRGSAARDQPWSLQDQGCRHRCGKGG
jgi:hypothetical protein